jgi:hypothetical protein
VNPLLLVARPRSLFTIAALNPRLAMGGGVVLASGIVSLALDVVANALRSGGGAGMVAALVLPALFLAYWALQAWVIDVGAALLSVRGRLRPFMAASGWAFPPWVAYAVLAVFEALAVRYTGGPESGIASALAWLTLPILAWFITLTVFAVQAVYQVPALNAFALALLPIAFVSAALLIVGVVLGALHGAGTF